MPTHEPSAGLKIKRVWCAGLIAIGVVHAFSFSAGPLPAWMLPYIEILSLAALAYLVFAAPTIKQAGLAGFLFGLGNFTAGFYWLHISMHQYGGMNFILSATAVLVLAAAEALFIVLATAFARWLSARHLHIPSSYRWHLLIVVVWASCWTGAEWLRGTLFTGFPWLNIGYAHSDGLLAGWAPILGVYGVAWLAAFAAGAIGLLAITRNTNNDARAAAVLGVAIATGLAGIALGHINWARPHGAPLIVRLIQGNVPQSEKFDPDLMRAGITAYMQLAALPPKESDAAPAIIVLPETIMPLLQDRFPAAVWQQWLDIAAQRNATILMGVPLHDVHNGAARYTNSAIAFSARTPLSELMTGATALRYDKNHLVPFGEFVPPGFRWFVDAMNIPLGDFDRGPVRQRLFEISGQTIAPDICFEDVFGEEIIQSVRDSGQYGRGANILVNISNLAWFGDSWALRQHLQISRMRALETARPMIRATNTGMTAAIDPNGVVRAALTPLNKGVLDVEVQGFSGFTPYVRWGNWPILIWTAIVLALGASRRKRRPPQPPRATGA